MPILTDIKDYFFNRGGRFSGRYRDRGSYYQNTFQFLADVPELWNVEFPYFRGEDQWMSEHDQFRLQMYKFNRALYAGDHYNAFRFAQYLYNSGMLDDDARVAEIFGKGGADVLFVAMNLFQLVTDTFADLIAEALGPIVPADDGAKEWAAVRRISKNSELKQLVMRSVLTGSYKGDMVWTVHGHGKTNDGQPAKVWIRGERADTWFPTIDETNRTRFSEHAFCFPIKDTENKKTYVAKKLYKANEIFLTAREIEGNKFMGMAPRSIFVRAFGENTPDHFVFPDEFKQLPLVIHVPNKISDDEDPYGTTDYGQGVLTLADEVNHRLTQLSYGLDKHANLGMTGPRLEGEETQNPNNDNPTNRGASGRYISRDPEDVEPKYIEIPTSHMSVMLEEIHMLCEEKVRQMRMSPRLLGFKAGAAEEAFDTLRLACVNTLLRNKGRITYLGPGLQAAMESALALERHFKVEGALDDTPELRIKWGDGFPIDEEKRARTWAIRTNNEQTATAKQAIQDMDGPEGAEETVAAIRSEGNDNIAATPGFQRAGRRDLSLNLPAEEPEINAGQEDQGARTQSR